MILIILNFLICVVLAVDISPEEASFINFVKQYNIVYDSKEEQLKRERIFNFNVQKLRQLDCQTCGITKFTATTQEQMDQIQNLRLPENIQELAANNNKLKLSSDSNKQLTNEAPPTSLDWRAKGAVSPVKAQGTCGTCWSFTTVAMSQSSLILKGNGWNSKLYSTKLSEQYLLKCTAGSSCDGGYLENAIDKALQRGLPYQSQYPYRPFETKNNGVCSTNDLIEISNKTRVSRYYIDDSEIIQMLQDGPVAIAVSATGWQNYRSGTFKCNRNSKINHAVLLVGYTPQQWIIKNSWGSDFGDSGFIYVTRNKLQNCGIGVAVHALSQLYLTHIIVLILLIFYVI